LEEVNCHHSKPATKQDIKHSIAVIEIFIVFPEFFAASLAPNLISTVGHINVLNFNTTNDIVTNRGIVYVFVQEVFVEKLMLCGVICDSVGLLL
jgi:hypothetical protein